MAKKARAAKQQKEQQIAQGQSAGNRDMEIAEEFGQQNRKKQKKK